MTRRYGRRRGVFGRSTIILIYCTSWFIWFYWWCLKYIPTQKFFPFPFRRPSILEWLEFANLTKEVRTNSGTIGPHFSRPDSIALFLAITHFTLMKSNPPRALLMDILSMEFSQRQTIPSLEVPSVDSLSKISLKGIIEEIIRYIVVCILISIDASQSTKCGQIIAQSTT